MAIDTSGKWWEGTEFADLAEYLRLYTKDGYPATVTKQSVCSGYGGTSFRMYSDPEQGGAKRVCTACKIEAYLCDSGEYWENVEPRQCACPCKGRHFEVRLGSRSLRLAT